MSRLPQRIQTGLDKEARELDRLIEGERPEQVDELLDGAELFKAVRPPRQPVSLRLDPFDLSMIKRIAREKGIPHTTLMASWLHEKVEREKDNVSR